MATTTTTRKRKKKIYESGNFFSAPVKTDEKFVTIKLPVKVAEYLELKDGQSVFWTPINGTVQISANQPHVAIPMMSVVASNFVPQR